MAAISEIANKHRPDLAPYEELYKYYHANPELSDQEKETSAHIVQDLKKISSDFDIRPNIGGYGIAALFRNGSGPTVLLRADFDGLPVEERTDLPYASRKRMVSVQDNQDKPVMHACGHDIHITSLLAAAETLLSARQSWSGTLILAFQPAEERGTGAQAMIDDGLYDPKRHNVPIPDICIGGHVIPWRAGTIGTRRGLIATSADSMRITLHGRGGHASMPHRLVDPVVMAASTIMKLQTIVSRETDPADMCVVTVASIQAGDTENIVVDDAKIAVDVRAVTQKTRNRALASVRRIVKAESESFQAVKEPTINVTRNFPLTINDEASTAKVEQSFAAHFAAEPVAGETAKPSAASLPSTHHSHPSTNGIKYDSCCEKLTGSEDFSILGSAVNRPTVFFMYGGTPHELWDKCEAEGTLGEKIPVNHSGLFAPQISPTLRVGIDSYVVGALTFLGKK